MHQRSASDCGGGTKETASVIVSSMTHMFLTHVLRLLCLLRSTVHVLCLLCSVVRSRCALCSVCSCRVNMLAALFV
jgi:hypothetical protein